MERWEKELRVDPIPVLLSSNNTAIDFFARRDLLYENTGSIETLWELPQVKKILNRQLEDGCWKYPGGGKENLRSKEDYNQLETYRVLGQLVEKYGLNNQHSGIKKAAEYLFSCQTREGDFRGIYGNQYSSNYTAAIMELLIKAGYKDDPRIINGFTWLLNIRQKDGGWAIPLRTVGVKFNNDLMATNTVQPDLTKPSSHLVTGVVLRAFAAHEDYKKTDDAIRAGELLTSRFFKKDAYPDRQTVEYWTRVSFPFWFTDIVSALDSLSLMGFTMKNIFIKDALGKLKNMQRDDGLFELKLLKTGDRELKFWVCLAVCKIFKRLLTIDS
ncbi:MAG: hypothetical protein M1371_02560 [Actinobacteria bacterium]|nr:hypothetical protein [Actinomycetota bacterium]